MSAELRERIASDVRAELADPVIAERLAVAGLVLNLGTAAEFAAAIDKQRAQVAKTGHILGIKPAE